MEKLQAPISLLRPAAKLFLDDLKAIENFIKENNLSYYFILDNYKLETLDELSLIENKNEFYHLEIVVKEPWLKLSINDVTSIVGEEDYILLGIVEKIKPIIKKRYDFFRYIVWPLLLLANLTNILLFFLSDNDYIHLPVMIFTLLLTAQIVTKTISKNPNGVVFVNSVSAQDNFFSRNKDKIVTNMISSLFGLITGILLMLLKFKLEQT